MAPPLTLSRSKGSRCQMDSKSQCGSFMSRHRRLSRCLVAGTAMVIVAAGEQAAFAQSTVGVSWVYTGALKVPGSCGIRWGHDKERR